MGMGYGACFAEVIEVESIRKFCKKEFDIFVGLVEGKGDYFACDFARNAESGDLSNYNKRLIEAYKNLQKAFEKKTGLNLFIDYHSAKDDGDRYDEVDGIYWAVGGMYQLTKAGKNMEKYVNRKFFVTFG